MEPEACCSRQTYSFDYCVECPALLEQVPETFFFGTTNVGLRCFDVSRNYFVFGSDCGALFPFNRRIGRSATPLRTHYDEVVTCIKLFSGQDDFVAAGHESGILVILRFPSSTGTCRRKMLQHLDAQLHQNHALSCLEWNDNGTMLLSADMFGAVCATRDSFESILVCNKASCILQMFCAADYLSVDCGDEVLIINFSREFVLTEVQGIQCASRAGLGMCLINTSSTIELFVGSNSGDFYQYDGINGALLASLQLNHLVELGANEASSKVICKVYPLSNKTILYYYSGIFALIAVEGTLRVVSHFRLKKFDLFQHSVIEEVVVESQKNPSVFFLTGDKKIYCIASADPPAYLTVINERPHEFIPLSLISSIQKTTKLLPFAPTLAILNRLKPNAKLNLSSLPNLALSPFDTVIKSGQTVLKNNASDCNLRSEGDSSDGDSIKKRTESRGSNSSSSSLHSKWIENVNEVSRYVVDVVGGAGVPVLEGLLVKEVVPVTSLTLSANEELPQEEIGVFDEVRVQRNQTASRRKISSSTLISPTSDANFVCTDAITPVDDKLLTNIREALRTATLGPAQDTPDKKTFVTEKKATDEKNSCETETEALHLSLASPSLQITELKLPSKETEIENAESVTVKQVESGMEIESSISEQCAYESLMDCALKSRSVRFMVKKSTEEANFIDDEFSEAALVVGDKGDIWNEIRIPFACSSFSVTSKYIIIFGAKKPSHPRFMLLSEITQGSWLKMRQKAEFVAMNDDNSLLWRIQKGVAYAPLLGASDGTPLLLAPKWHAVANEVDGIAEVALTRNSAWYLTKSGQVFTQLRLPKIGLLSRCESPWALRSITASEVAVWALQVETGHLVVRAGLKHCLIGLDWVEIEPEGPTRLLSICLFGHSGWAIDETFRLWFTNGIDFQNPFGTSGVWLQVCSPWTVLPDFNRCRLPEVTIRVSSFGVFVNVGQRAYWSSFKNPVSGHTFKRIVPEKLVYDDCFEMISAECFNYNDIDFITLCRRNELYLFRLKTKNFFSLPAFAPSFGVSILQISSYCNSVYVLDSSGCIYVKTDIGSVTPFGSDWSLLDTGDCDSPIISFAVTSRSIWIVTSSLKIYMHKRLNNVDPRVGATTTWKCVDSSGIVANQIRASKSGSFVWVFSTSLGQAWARSCINGSFPFGKSWLEASSDPPIAGLAVGCAVVWSFSANGKLYKLHGLSVSNPAGNYWKPVPKNLKALSLDSHENLWGIDEESRIFYHKVETYPPTFNASSMNLEKNSTSAEEENEFVIV